MGPYEIVSISNNGSNVFLNDKYSHFMKKSVPAGHLVMFHPNSVYRADAKSKVFCESEKISLVSKVDMNVDSTDTEMGKILVDHVNKHWPCHL